MKLHDLQPAPGATKNRTRKARGIAAGKGKTAGRGMNGQNARAGGGVRPFFEGGQIPLVRRIPHKRGFRNRCRVRYVPVNLDRLAAFVDEASPHTMAQAGLIQNESLPVVVLGDGELDRPLTVRAHRFSASARRKIEAAGGLAQVIPLAPDQAPRRP